VAQNGVEITSTATSPTQQNPIPIEIKFEEAVNEIDETAFDILNGTLQNLERVNPDFSYIGSKGDLTGFTIDKTLQEILNDIGGIFNLGNLGPYLEEQLSEAVISIDFNGNDQLFYLTYGEGLFQLGNPNPVIAASNFDTPLDFVINRSNGRIYVADHGKKQILVFNDSFELINEIGSGTDAESKDPRGTSGLALDKDGNIYNADNYTGNTAGNFDAIKIYSSEGDWIHTIDNFKGDPIQDPLRIAVDKEGNIFLSDAGGNNGRVLIYDKNYNPITIINQEVQGSPGSLVTDAYGYLYVADFADDFDLNALFNDPLDLLDSFEGIEDGNYEIKVYDPRDNYSLIGRFPSENLGLPIDLAINSCGRIYVNNMDVTVNSLDIGRIGSFPVPNDVDVDFNFSLKEFWRQDNFTAELVPEVPGLVEVILKDVNLFQCDPQPEGDFSIIYEVDDPSNAAPVAVADSYTVEQDDVLTVDEERGVLSNDSDADGDALTAELQSNVSYGTLTLNADGSFVYTPDAGFIGEDEFTYTAFDGEDYSGAVTVTITVTAASVPNTAPVAVADSYTVEQDDVLTVDEERGVLSNDSDADGDALTAELQTNVSYGTLTLNADGSFVYTPDAGFIGEDEFTYTAFDGEDYSGAVTVTITVTAASVPNTAPVAVADSYTVEQDDVLTVDEERGVLSNDSDADGDALTAELQTNVSYGTLTLNADGSFVYTPDVGFIGEDEFTYTAFDGEDYSGAVTVTITVTAVSVPNTAPVAVADSYTVEQDDVLTVDGERGVLSNDSDADGDALTAELQTNVSYGTLTLNADGSFVYTPDAGFIGEDEFTYAAFDGEDYSGAVTVTITVTAASVPNTAPVAVADSYTVEQDDVLTVDEERGVLSNDSDADGDALTAELQTNVSNGTLTLNPDGSFVYTPDAGFTGEDVFTYRAFDGEDYSGAVTVTITVTAASVDPSFTCLEIFTMQLDANGQATLSAEDLYSGDAEGVTFNLDKENFTCEDIGTQTITLNYQGAKEGSCEIEITIEDNMKPTASCVSEFTLYLNEEGYGIISADIVDNGSRDNCGEVEMSLSKTRFEDSDVGENTVILTVTDAAGNTDTCETIVTVVPYEIGREVFCPEDITISLEEDGEFELVLRYSGNAENIEIAVSKSSFTCDDIGTQVITATYFGEFTGSCDINVTVIDDIPPVIDCIQEIDLMLDASGTAGLSTDQLALSFSDNCGSTEVSLSKSEFTTADLGTQQVVLTVTDGSGNSSTCMVTVNVLRYENPDGDTIKLYPNPSLGQVILRASPGLTIQSIEVFDMRGRFLFEKQYNEEDNLSSDYELDLRKYQSGVYTLLIHTNEREFLKRAIIRN
jgi:VCBS repeat-containing protein